MEKVFGEVFLSQRGFLSLTLGCFFLTERTEYTEPFGAQFELTEGLRHTEFTERYC